MESFSQVQWDTDTLFFFISIMFFREGFKYAYFFLKKGSKLCLWYAYFVGKIWYMVQILTQNSKIDRLLPEKAKNCRAAIAARWKFENFGNAWVKIAVKVGKKSKWSLKYMLRLCLFFQKFEGFMLINLMLIKKKECKHFFISIIA